MSGTMLSCQHKVHYAELPPRIDDIVFCIRCRDYRTVYTSGRYVFFAYCAAGNPDPIAKNDDCFNTQQFSAESAAIRWANSHLAYHPEHTAIIEDRREYPPCIQAYRLRRLDTIEQPC